MVAAPTLKRYAWSAAAVLAAAAIVVLALHGRRPEPGFVRFEAAGVMVHITPESVSEVDVVAGDRRWRFTRTGTGEWSFRGPSGPAADWQDRVENGLRFLHNSAPQRVINSDELGDASAAEFGLAPPRYTVSVSTASAAGAFVISFGSPNPQGLAQYASVAGRSNLYLLSRFVGAEWEAATGIR